MCVTLKSIVLLFFVTTSTFGHCALVYPESNPDSPLPVKTTMAIYATGDSRDQLRVPISVSVHVCRCRSVAECISGCKGKVRRFVQARVNGGTLVMVRDWRERKISPGPETNVVAISKVPSLESNPDSPLPAKTTMAVYATGDWEYPYLYPYMSIGLVGSRVHTKFQSQSEEVRSSAGKWRVSGSEEEDKIRLEESEYSHLRG